MKIWKIAAAVKKKKKKLLFSRQQSKHLQKKLFGPCKNKRECKKRRGMEEERNYHNCSFKLVAEAWLFLRRQKMMIIIIIFANYKKYVKG